MNANTLNWKNTIFISAYVKDEHSHDYKEKYIGSMETHEYYDRVKKQNGKKEENNFLEKI